MKRIVNNGPSCISPGISDQNSAIHSDLLLTDNNWKNWTAFFSIQSNETGQHDQQDKRLTGQLPNQSGHCPSTSRYFEPCIIIDPCLMDYNIIILALF